MPLSRSMARFTVFFGGLLRFTPSRASSDRRARGRLAAARSSSGRAASPRARARSGRARSQQAHPSRGGGGGDARSRAAPDVLAAARAGGRPLVVVNLAGKAGDALAAVLVECARRPRGCSTLNANDAKSASFHRAPRPFVRTSSCASVGVAEDPGCGGRRRDFAGAVRSALDDVSPGMRRKIEASKPWFEERLLKASGGARAGAPLLARVRRCCATWALDRDRLAPTFFNTEVEPPNRLSTRREPERRPRPIEAFAEGEQSRVIAIAVHFRRRRRGVGRTALARARGKTCPSM